MTASRESFGRDVIGPITGEFCLRLWALGAMLERPGDTAMLFCARGGLRLMLAYERFLEVCRLLPPTRIEPLMVSRVVAVRPAIVAGAGSGTLAPSAASVLGYEFAQRPLREVVRAISGCDVGDGPGALDPFSPQGLLRLLASPQGVQALQSITADDTFFRRHLAAALDGRSQGMLVDTGLFGSTLQLLDEGIADVGFSCALIARTRYGGRQLSPRHQRKIFGLCVETDGYSPLQRRSAMLRYWHLIESTFEPPLRSVRHFSERDGGLVSNLEVPGWRDRIQPSPGSVFAGVMAYVESLSGEGAAAVLSHAGRAWSQLYRRIVWPDQGIAAALDVGERSNDFGEEGTSAARPWRGPLHALTGHALWREGEIARSGTTLRLPLLATVEAGYGARRILRHFAKRSTS